jgi:hypothetical protein
MRHPRGMPPPGICGVEKHAHRAGKVQKSYTTMDPDNPTSLWIIPSPPPRPWQIQLGYFWKRFTWRRELTC